MRIANAIGVIFLIGAAWVLAAQAFGWDNAGFFSAAVFGIVVYFGFKTAK